jgi:hypothetical protein
LVEKSHDFDIIDMNNTGEIEAICINLKKENDMLIVALYGKPRCNLNLEFLTEFLSKHKQKIILGDLNATHN